MAAQYILEHSSYMTPDPDGFRRSMRDIVKFHLRNPFNVSNPSFVFPELKFYSYFQSQVYEF